MIDDKKPLVNVVEVLDTDIAKRAYDDFVHPPAKVAGEMLTKPFNLLSIFGDAILFFPEKLRLHMKHNLEETRRLLEKKMKTVSTDEMVEPNPSIQIAALDAIAKAYDSECLRELFANLLLKASHMRTQYKIHPAYIEIISRITHYDAEFISALYASDNLYFPLFNIVYNVCYKDDGSQSSSRGMYKTAVHENIAAPFEEYDNLELTGLSITQLKSLGIIRIEPEFYNKTPLFEIEKERIKGLDLYKNALDRFVDFRTRIEQRNNLPSNLTQNLQDEYLDFNMYKVEFSDFGIEFAKICISPEI